MKTLMFLVFVLMNCAIVNAQTFEEDVAFSSCECLKKEKVVVDSVMNRCISRAMWDVASKDSTRVLFKRVSTVEGIVTTNRSVRTLLSKNCQEAILPKKKKQ